MAESLNDSKAAGHELRNSLVCINSGISSSHQGFLLSFGVFLVVFTGCLAWAAWPDGKILGNTVCTDEEFALESLKLTKDWGVWMAGIQTAMLAALGILAKDTTPTFKPSKWQTRLMLATAILNTLALFLSAWLLTSTSSIALRLFAPHPKYGYDYYNFSIWSFLPDQSFLAKAFSVGFVALCNHWFWALGIISFGLLTVSLAISRSEEKAQA